MVIHIKNLIRSAWDAYQEGGLPLFFERVGKFINRKLKLIFKPKIPLIGIDLWTNRIEIGYRSKYVYNGNNHKIIPEKNDTVVEAGIHRGKDTATFGKLANKVVGFEPSPRNYSEARKNLEKFNNIDIINRGLWNKNTELEIMYGEVPGDDGFLKSNNNSGENHKIPVNTLENYLEKLEIKDIDFLKIEAEGAEPEIIEGMGELRPQNIVINADEERNGQPTGVAVMELLQPMGYTLVGLKWGHILFFSFEDVSHSAFRSEFE